MIRMALALAICTVFTACAAGATRKPSESVPHELVPPGFTAAECHVVKAAEALTDDGPGTGPKYTTGTRSPQVECQHPGNSIVTTKSVPVCHTKSGKQLPLADCCMTDSGEPIPACTLKIQPDGE